MVVPVTFNVPDTLVVPSAVSPAIRLEMVVVARLEIPVTTNDPVVVELVAERLFVTVLVAFIILKVEVPVLEAMLFKLASVVDDNDCPPITRLPVAFNTPATMVLL